MPFVEQQRESLFFLFPPLLIRHLDCSAMPKAVSLYPYITGTHYSPIWHDQKYHLLISLGTFSIFDEIYFLC